MESGASPSGQLSTVTARRVAAELITSEEQDRETLTIALRRFQLVNDAEREWRRRAAEELEFVDECKHWSEDQLAERGTRPCLEFDLVGPAIDQVVNNTRQNPPEARVAGVGGGADRAIAQVTMGMLRNIDNDSGAEIVWTHAHELAAKIGRGWVKVHFEFEDDPEHLFYQKVVLRRVSNWASIYPDPAAADFDYSDMRYCFETDTVDEELFKDENPDVPIPTQSELESTNDPIIQDWFPKGAVRMANYWRVKETTVRICQTSDGWEGLKADRPLGSTIVNERDRKIREVLCSRITGTSVLKTWIYPVPYIPLVPVLGRESWIKGKRKLRGMVRAAMDANLAYDYARSKEAEQITLSSISQWLAEDLAIEPYEKDFAESNTKAIAVLKFKGRDQDGVQLQKPERVSPEPASQALSVAIQHADADAKAMTSMYNPSLGAPDTQETSGKAILARQRQGDNAHFHYADNLSRSVRHATRIELALFPFIYSEARECSIADPDGSQRLIMLNQEFLDKKTGKSTIFQINSSTLRFHVTIGTGPSYASRKAQQTDALMQIGQAYPAAMVRALDLIAKYLDLPDEFADRWRPADIAAQQQQEGDEPPTAEQLQQTLTQQKQLLDKVMASLQEVQGKLKTKQMELESKERMNALDNQTLLTTAALKAQAQTAQAGLAAEASAIQHRLDLLHENVPLIASDGPPADGSDPNPQPQPAADAGAPAQA